MLYPQNGGRIVAIDCVTPLHPMYYCLLSESATATTCAGCLATCSRQQQQQLCISTAVGGCVCVWRARHKKPGDSTRQQTDKQTDRQTDRDARTETESDGGKLKADCISGGAATEVGLIALCDCRQWTG